MMMDFNEASEIARREAQRRENQLIGKRIIGSKMPENIDLETALARFVFISDGSRVADLQSLSYDMKLFDFSKTFMASKKEIKVRKDDKEIKVIKQVLDLWMDDPSRKTTSFRTFKAGGDLFLDDPDGRPSLNTWAGFPEFPDLSESELLESQAQLFIDHIHFLFGDQSEAFLDWLAHIQQKPDELPHFCYLHIATQTGMGRNYIASVLTRLWAGSVAPCLDLVNLLQSNFNGQLSRKVLAIVDEIHAGGSGKQWEHAEKLKSILTQDKIFINPKYGRTSVEYNSCRFLIFSNHLSAIPLDNNDRRFAVKTLEEKPKDSNYYEMLYGLLNDPMFLAGISHILKNRDISYFKAGKPPELTEDKINLISQNMSDEDYWCELVVKHWVTDIITNEQFASVLNGSDGSISPHRNTANRWGVKNYPKPVKIGGKLMRIKILRNHNSWMTAGTDHIAKAIVKEQPLISHREMLQEMMEERIDPF